MPDKVYIDKIVYGGDGIYIQIKRKCGCGYVGLLSKAEWTIGMYVCGHICTYVCVCHAIGFACLFIFPTKSGFSKPLIHETGP